MWKVLSARTEQDLCAQLNQLGVEAAQILPQGVRYVAFYFEAKKRETKSKNSKEGDS